MNRRERKLKKEAKSKSDTPKVYERMKFDSTETAKYIAKNTKENK